MKRRVATIVSRIFDPVVALSIVLILTFLRGSETSPAVWIGAAVLIIGLPVVLVLIAIRKKIIGNWDISNHSERPKALTMLLTIESINLLIMESLIHPSTFHILLMLFIVLIGFTLITFSWKISGHTMANALLTGCIISWYGWEWWPLLLIVPLVAWARVVRKDHTIPQVFAGALYSWVLLVIFEYLIIGTIG